MSDARNAVIHLRNLTPEQLSQFFAIDNIRAWSDEDALVALQQQLAAPLLPELFAVSGLTRSQILGEVERAGVRTFLDALIDAAASLPLLEAIQSFAQQVGSDRDNPLCGAPATLLYYAAGAAALAGCNKRIGELADEQWLKGFRWALKQPGAGPLAAVFSSGIARLETSSQAP